jgi:hypothetical protein
VIEPANDLEQKLMLAANDPASRPDFYKVLMDSQVFVIGFTDAGGEGVTTLPTGAKVSIESWEKNDGTKITPFFSSLDTLQRALKKESKYVSLPARSFFELTKGASLVLNPASPYGKEFYPNEVQALLDTGMNHVAQSRIVQKETKVLLGQPASYPTEMVSALASFLAKRSAIKAAYLCQMHDPSSSEGPSLVVGFEGGGGLARVMNEAGSIAADTVPKGRKVDFVVVKDGEAGLGSYMLKSVKPFYERPSRKGVWSLLGFGRA